MSGRNRPPKGFHSLQATFEFTTEQRPPHPRRIFEATSETVHSIRQPRQNADGSDRQRLDLLTISDGETTWIYIVLAQTVRQGLPGGAGNRRVLRDYEWYQAP